MKIKLLLLTVFVLLLTISVGIVSAGDDCTAIQDGVIMYSAGHYLQGTPLTTGYDAYGYNYQAHQFSGSYANVYLGRFGFPPYVGDDAAYLAANPGVLTHGYLSIYVWPYRTTQVTMKWNDAWLSNKDCDDDGSLDRHLGFPAYVGSGAWETNHQWDTYELNGELCEWDYFVKIVAAPADATVSDGNWYTASGVEIGYSIWGEFAVIQEVYNDPCGGYEGILYHGSNSSGFGAYAP